MVLYRRNIVEGGTYFFTVTLRNRQSDFLILYIDLFKKNYRIVKSRHPFKTLAYVILPDHCHVIWELPPEDGNYSLRWREIKKGFSQALIKQGIKLQKNKNREYDLWQRRYWEHTIRDSKDFENHVNYIHYNLVKHKLVKKAGMWNYSSFHDYVRKEVLPLNWAGVQGYESRIDDYGE
jgi:putative transposase